MTVRFFNTNNTGNSGSGGSINIKQITKLNVIAPHETSIDIPFTNSFKRLPIEVLKMEGGSSGVVETLCNFDNSDLTDFEENEYAEFDGTMKLKTDYELPTALTTTQNVYQFDFDDLDKFKKTVSIESEVR